MQAKNAVSEASAKIQPLSTRNNTTIPPMTTKGITAFADHPSEWHTKGTVTPVEKLSEAASPLISRTISKINDKKTAVRITNTAKSP